MKTPHSLTQGPLHIPQSASKTIGKTDSLFHATSQKVDRMSAIQRVEIQKIGGVTVVRFLDSRVTKPLEIEELGSQLYKALEFKKGSKLVIDFSLVEFLSSATIGKLISLNRKVNLAKSALRLCSLRQEIRDVFHLCNLERVFDIREDQAAAIASF